MAKQPSFNFGANAKKPKASRPKKSSSKGSKKITKAQAASIDWGSSKNFTIPD